MKLHLGCNNVRIPTYINVDIIKTDACDVVDDVKTLNKFQSYAGQINVIYASHILEHFVKNEYMEVLKNWYNLLSNNGVLRLSVPDFDSIVLHYSKYKNLKLLYCLLYGSQKNQFEFHYHVWTFETMKNDLINVGFKNVDRYDWKKTDHHDVDDHSQAYLPHIDKDNGMLMSLNIEAIK